MEDLCRRTNVAGVALGCLSGHAVMLPLLLLCRGFLGVGSTIGRVLRGEEMGQNRTLPELKDRRSDLPCSNYMPCVGE